MASAELREQLLSVMDRKNHWAWPQFAEGRVPLTRLLPHFQREWEVYVRDFPILLARVLGHGPPEPVRRSLAANIYEEQTGGISLAASHPALFMKMMRGCGYDVHAFEKPFLPDAAKRYRDFLDEMSWKAPWQRGAAVLTLFVEGSVNERAELAAGPGRKKSSEEIEAAIAKHPLVRFHRVDPEAMELARVHLRVEGGHRLDAWNALMGYVTLEQEPMIVEAMERALELWFAYRDEVVEACGISRS